MENNLGPSYKTLALGTVTISYTYFSSNTVTASVILETYS